MSFKNAGRATTMPRPRIALVDLRGSIRESSANGISFAGTKRQIDRAFHLRRLGGIALIVNSPGGSPAQSELLGNYIRRLADERKVPVYAFVEDVAASGGYWLAAAADEIYCAKSSMVGSIGVIGNVMNYHELAQKYGVRNVTVTAGARKSKLNSFQPIDPEDIKWLQGQADKMHVMFKDWIIQRRGPKLKVEHDKIFNGDVWTGEEAVAMGLADGIGSYPEVLNRIYDRPRFVPIRTPRAPILRIPFLSSQAPSLPDPVAMINDLIGEASIRKFAFT